MLFNSFEFLIFFPLVTILYWLVPFRFRWIHLLVASCIFYAAFIPVYLLVLFLLIVVDYVAGLLIERARRKKLFLIVSICANIGILAFFKYYDFFIENINSVSGVDFVLLNLALPIGLSFHTFQSLSYTIEVYRGNQKAVRHPGYYALYVMFYPQLVAGPIERPQHLIPQFLTARKFSGKDLSDGLRLMAWGFFKKVVIADRLSEYADVCFAHPATVNPAMLWIGIFFFCIQIYADFSGYSDIAIGAAKCMGYDLMTNFSRPYMAKNIKEYWNRWHISLSHWFRDYVYIPLGGNRKGTGWHYSNLLITFTLSGFWHGADWTFILWGFIHGVYMIIYHLYSGIVKWNMPKWLSWFITMFAIAAAFIIFRSADMNIATDYFMQSVNISELSANIIPVTKDVAYGNFSFLLIFVTLVFMFWVERRTDPKLYILDEEKYLDWAVTIIVMMFIIFFGIFNQYSFIYFQF